MKLRKRMTDTFWNSLGSGIFAAVSFLLLIGVTRGYGVEKAGSFGVAIATAQLMYRIGIFAMRQYQITDLNHEFPFSAYFSAKVASSLISLVVFSFYVIIDEAAKEEFWQFFWIFAFYQLLSIDDLYQNRLFQENRLDKAGISKCLVIGGYLCSFFILSICRMELNTILAVAFFVSFVISVMNCPHDLWREMVFVRDNSVFRAMEMAFPAFISNFLFAFINSLPKYTVYYFCSREESGYTNNIFMLLNVVELVGNFIYYPFIPDITGNMAKDPGKVRKLILRISAAIISVGCVMAVFMYSSGIMVFDFIYHKDFTGYIFEIIYTVSICGVLVALTALFYWIPVILREQKRLIRIFGAGTIAALAGCVCGSLKYGIRGAIAGHSLAVGIMVVLLLRLFHVWWSGNAGNETA